jgi:hypothetical protein
MTKAAFTTPPRADLRDEALARNLERLAWLMDRAIKVPGTKITVGLDSILGLLPVGGDVVTGCVQTALVLVALTHYKVPRHVALRMMANVLIDTGIGAIPLLGDLFDVAFKANTKNLALLQAHRAPRVIDITPGEARIVPSRRSGTPWRYIIPIGAVLLLALVLVFIGFLTVVRWMRDQPW